MIRCNTGYTDKFKQILHKVNPDTTDNGPHWSFLAHTHTHVIQQCTQPDKSHTDTKTLNYNLQAWSVYLTDTPPTLKNTVIPIASLSSLYLSSCVNRWCYPELSDLLSVCILSVTFRECLSNHYGAVTITINYRVCFHRIKNVFGHNSVILISSLPFILQANDKTLCTQNVIRHRCMTLKIVTSSLCHDNGLCSDSLLSPKSISICKGGQKRLKLKLIMDHKVKKIVESLLFYQWRSLNDLAGRREPQLHHFQLLLLTIYLYFWIFW